MKSTNKKNRKNSGKIEFFPEVKRDGWIIRMSVMDEHYILVMIRSELTGQLIVRYFDDEGIAADFIDVICEMESSQEQDV